MKKITLILLAGFILLTPIAASSNNELVVGTVERPPFSFYSNDRLTGFSVDLWDAIAGKIGVKYRWNVHQHFSEMIDDTSAGRDNLAIANISITSSREQSGDFSQPIFESGMAIAIKKSAQPSLLNLIWQSGVLLFLLGAFAVLLVIAHVLWLFERNVKDARHDYFRDDYLSGVWDAFWWAFIIMTMGGFENEVPHRKISRVLAMAWIVVSLFFISTITAKITTALTVAELQTDIESYRDLAGKRVGVTKGSSHQKFLNSKGIKSISYDTLDQMYSDLNREKLDAVIADLPILSYFANHGGAGWMSIAGEPFSLESFGLFFPENSPLIEPVNVALLKFREEGGYIKLQEKYFGE